MKRTQRFCDFCGHKVDSKREIAKLTVPLSKEEQQLKRRIDGATAEQPDYGAMLTVSLFGPPVNHDSQEFDMCLGCARGLLRLRFETLRKVLEAVDA